MAEQLVKNVPPSKKFLIPSLVLSRNTLELIFPRPLGFPRQLSEALPGITGEVLSCVTLEGMYSLCVTGSSVKAFKSG